MKKFLINLKKKYITWVTAIAIIVLVVALLRSCLLFFGFISYGKDSVVAEFRKNKNSFVELTLQINNYVKKNDLEGCSISYHSGVFSESKTLFYVRKGRTSTEQEIDPVIKNLSQKIFNIMCYQSIVADSDGQILFRLPNEQGIAYLPHGGRVQGDYVSYSQNIGDKWYYFEEDYQRISNTPG